ncbi:MAG TPA: carbamoyltransferase [Candidatus Hydrogenedentes bacterium]|nr:carbamoyltransferase [Candidatus Hydrogenedentota bacterium]HRK32956.1 carbamoyltransferase [Candidatus Hydrogenedentota bacterium]
MNVLGIGGYSHDSAAALVCDGQLVAAVAEERLTRVKHQGGVPRKAVQFCLDTAGISIDDIDHVCAYMRPGLRVGRRVPYRLSQLFRSPSFSAGYIAYELQHNAEYMLGMRSLVGKRAQLHYMHHHPAHAASSFLVSPFDEAALLTIDYVGEWDVTWGGIGKGTTITRLSSEHYPNSLGVLYTGLTDYLGFARASDEYKVMGLASYGEPEYADEFRRIVKLMPGGRYQIDLSWLQCHYLAGSRCGYMSSKFIERFGPARQKNAAIESKHQNIAASLQCVLEETVLHIARHLHSTTRQKKLCLAGGVALNCSMNGRLLREGPFDEIFVQPAAGDDGIAIGAGFQKHHELTGAKRSFELKHAQWGPEFSNDAIRQFLDLAKLPYESPSNTIERTADLLAAGKIVGWYQGRMEFGPRALGSRSILADPTRADMKDLINKFVKHREEFRPFAPSCLAERASEYFEGCASSPFMLFVYPVNQAKRASVPAITHVDGTARVQTVTRDSNPKFYALIEAFEKRRGVPMVLNTSFNIMGEPIVNTPSDAVRCFYGTGMDALVIGDYVLTKQ